MYWDICLVWEATLLLPVYTLPCPLAASCCWTAAGNSWLHFMAWALPASTNGPGLQGMAGKLGVYSSPPHSLSVGNLWERAERWLPGVCWFSRFHPSFVCGMNPYLIRKHTSGWHNAKQRSAVRAREWDPKQEDIKHPSCPLPCKKGKCCVTGLSKKNKELDILFKGNQNLELAKQ